MVKIWAYVHKVVESRMITHTYDHSHQSPPNSPFEHYSAEWYCRLWPDNYVFKLRLEDFLRSQDPSESVIYGRMGTVARTQRCTHAHMRTSAGTYTLIDTLAGQKITVAGGTRDYLDGGGGWAISGRALKDWVKRAGEDLTSCDEAQNVTKEKRFAEDVVLSFCLDGRRDCMHAHETRLPAPPPPHPASQPFLTSAPILFPRDAGVELRHFDGFEHHNFVKIQMSPTSAAAGAPTPGARARHGICQKLIAAKTPAFILPDECKTARSDNIKPTDNRSTFET